MKLKISFFILSCFFIILSAGTCNESYKCPEDPVTDIDPLHAQFSPFASKIFLKLLQSDSCKEKGNVKLFVVYTSGEYAKDTIAILHEGTKVILRDDGVFPDVNKNDREYTAIIKIDTALLRSIYGRAETAVSKVASQTDGNFVSFNGREVANTMKVSAVAAVDPFNFTDFTAGKKTELIQRFPADDQVRNNCLYIINRAVVEDPTRTWIPNNPASNPSGSWSFKKIMEGLANTSATGISAEDFTLQWLQSWMNGGTVNGDAIPKRAMENFIQNWPKISGKLDLTKAPFKLLAIVNRLDLMPNPVFTNAKNGGELRFVFGVMNPQNPMQVMGRGDIIFEFGVNKTGKDLEDYAKALYSLKDMVVGSALYNAKLESITNDIITAGDEPSKPNGSNLNQLRTNEILFGPWQLREFVIDNVSHKLVGTTIKQEPADAFNTPGNTGSLAALKKFADDHEKAIEKNHYTIPEKLPDGSNFLGGKTDYPSGGVWGNDAAGKITSNQARFVISINTCSGCHLNEGRLSFLHNENVAFGTETRLSNFIIGNATVGLGNNTNHSVANDTRGLPRSFNDLARRAVVLWGYVNSHPTFFGLMYNPVNMEH